MPSEVQIAVGGKTKMDIRCKLGMMLVFAVVVSATRVRAAETGPDYNRAGQWGVGVSAGTTSPGIGVRYWFTDKLAFDAGGAFSLDSLNNDTSSEHQDWGGNGQLVYVLKKRKGLRLEGLFGVNYDHNETDTQSQTTTFDTENLKSVGQVSATTNLVQTTTVGVGLAAEYSFEELPDLGFSAFATGFGAAFVTQNETTNTQYPGYDGASETQTLTQSYVTFATRPSIGLSVHYYF
jgi:hypothetical protein